MGDDSKIGIVDRIKGAFNKKTITPSSKVDEYVTQNLPDYIEDYKLARKDDLKGVPKRVEEFSKELSELKNWEEDTSQRLEEAKKKVKRLEKLHGIER